MAWERKILIFLRKMNIFDSASGSGQKGANALETKNIDFPIGKCTFLETEEGLDVAWERKIFDFPSGR